MTNVTCALLVTTPTDKILVVHPTNAGYFGCWSLPKGIKETTETAADAAARECFEETGLDFRSDTSSFTDLGQHPYVKGKDLHLFHYQVGDELDNVLFECTTHFTDKKGNQVVEVDRFEIVAPELAMKLLNQKQAKILLKAKETI